MPLSKICPTEGCGTEVEGVVTDGKTVWDCPNCDWCLEITITLPEG